MLRTIGFLFLVFIFLSCEPRNEPSLKRDTEYSDSLALKYNSSELKSVNDLLRKQPSDAGLYYQRGTIYGELRLWKEAENDLLRAIRLDSSHVEYYMKLSDIYFASNQTRKSKEMLERVVRKFPEHTEAYLKLGELYYIVRKYPEAAEMVNSALRIESDRPEAYLLRGNIYREWGDTNRAISSFQTATELDPTNADAWYDLGLMYFYKSDPLSISYFKKSLSILRSARNGYALGQAYQKLGRYEDALKTYDSVLLAFPHESAALYSKGAILAEVYHKYEDAEKIFSELLTYDSTLISARVARAWCYENTRRKKDAISEYQKVLKFQPDHAVAIEALNRLR